MALRHLALGLAVPAVAIPALAFVATPAQADVERYGSCAGATYEFHVDRENRRTYEVGVDVDNARPGSSWVVVLKHDGKRIHRGTYRADNEGELDVERYRPDTAGSDRFRMRIKPAGAGSFCSRTITMR